MRRETDAFKSSARPLDRAKESLGTVSSTAQPVGASERRIRASSTPKACDSARAPEIPDRARPGATQRLLLATYTSIAHANTRARMKRTLALLAACAGAARAMSLAGPSRRTRDRRRPLAAERARPSPAMSLAGPSRRTTTQDQRLLLAAERGRPSPATVHRLGNGAVDQIERLLGAESHADANELRDLYNSASREWEASGQTQARGPRRPFDELTRRIPRVSRRPFRAATSSRFGGEGVAAATTEEPRVAGGAVGPRVVRAPRGAGQRAGGRRAERPALL